MEAGQRIGQYLLLEKLGDGGMGEVWKAQHTLMHRTVAIKFLRQGVVLVTVAKDRFLNESRLQSRLQHPNIVAVYDAFEEGDLNCMAMEFVDGESLEGRLERQRPGVVPLPEVLQISTDVLAGLHYAHTFPLGPVVHRDIKPSNILIDRTGRSLITDFGVAFALDSHRLTREGTTLGTVFYMSPEQIQDSRKVDARSDIYSFGCVLYELLAGRPPFGAEGDTDFTIKTLHVREMPTPLRTWNGSVPFDLEWIVYKALNKEPAMRFASCAEMARALSDAVLSRRATPVVDFAAEERADSPVAPALGAPNDVPEAAGGNGRGPAPPSKGGLVLRSPLPAPPPTAAVVPLVPLVPQNSTVGTGRETGRKGPRLGLWVTLAAVAVLLVAGFFVYRAMFSDQIVLVMKGSTSVGDELAPKMAEAFLRDQMKADKTGMEVASRDAKGHAVVHVWGDVPGHMGRQVVEIYATGSGDAFRCLAAEPGPDFCDLGMASRPFGEDDRKKFPVLGNLNSPGSEHVIALDGIAVIVHPSNPVSRLSMQQLKAIYLGQITNWSQVGGDDRPIDLYGRDQASGTGEMFAGMVVGKDERGQLRQVAVPDDHRLNDSGAVVDAVLKSPQAIGYVSSPLVREAKALAISDGPGAALRPTELAIVTEDYPIGRRLYLYQTGRASTLARSFVHYAVNAQGQAVAAEAHYVGLTPRAFSAGEIAAGAPPLYRQVTSRDDKLGLSFRFGSGKASVGGGRNEALDNLAEDNVARLESYLAQHPTAASRVELIGFADNVGGAEENRELAKNRAVSVANELLQDDIQIPDGHLYSLGSEMPVASNDTEQGKSRNRRVEVWVPKGVQ